MKKEYKNNNNKSSTNKINGDISSEPNGGMPEDVFELVNRYGTYEIQATADTENQYPAIAQGFNEKMIQFDGENKDAEKYRRK